MCVPVYIFTLLSSRLVHLISCFSKWFSCQRGRPETFFMPREAKVNNRQHALQAKCGWGSKTFSKWVKGGGSLVGTADCFNNWKHVAGKVDMNVQNGKKRIIKINPLSNGSQLVCWCPTSKPEEERLERGKSTGTFPYWNSLNSHHQTGIVHNVLRVKENLIWAISCCLATNLG